MERTVHILKHGATYCGQDIIVGGGAGVRVVNSMDERILARVVGGTFMVLGVVMTLLRFI